MADRYWVGGTANWDGTAGTKWSATDGGLGGASVPTTADDVFFTASSTGTCTIASGNTGAKSINCTGFTGGLTMSSSITVAGGITLVSGMTFTGTSGVVTFTGTGTLTTAGKSFRAINVNGTGITITLGGALSTGAGTLTITAGTFDTANYNVTTLTITSSGTSSRTITLGSSTISSSGSLNFIDATNLTFNAGTSQINLSSASAQIVSGGALTFYNVSFTSTATGTRALSGSSTFNNLTLNASATGLSQFSIGANQTVNGTFTCAGSSAIARGFVRSSTFGTTRTITAATLSANDCDFRDITIAGGAVGTAPTRAGDCGGNSGITFPAAKTVYRVGTDTTWAGSSSWALNSGDTGSNANFPLPQDTAVIDDNTALTGTLGLAVYNISGLDASTRTTGITLNHAVLLSRYGSYILGSGVSISGVSTQSFAGRGTSTFISAGKTITFPILIDVLSGTFQLGDNLNSTNFVTLGRGTFNTNNYSLTCTQFLSNNSNTRTLTMGSGLWTLTGTNVIVWDVISSNFTFNKDTANILLSDTSASPRTFAGGGLTYNKLTIGGATGTSTLTFTGSNTFSELASTKTVAHTLSFTAGTTTTVDNWTITGTAGNIVTIQSATAASHTLTKTGGGTISTNYMSISRSTATPSDTWYAGTNSTDGGNNSGWIFTDPPAPSTATGNMFFMFN